MKTGRLLSAILVAALLISGCGCAAGAKKGKDVPANPVEKEGFKLIFSDEFDEEKIDTKK